jgi:hypothetical protein
VTTSVQTKRDQMRRIMQLPPPPPPAPPAPASTEEAAPTLHSKVESGDGVGVSPEAAKDAEDAISEYLRRATENFDLSKNVEVCKRCLHCFLRLQYLSPQIRAL